MRQIKSEMSVVSGIIFEGGNSVSRFGEYKFDYYKLYVLALEGNKFYVGITKDIERRVAEHKSGIGASYTHKNRPLGIVYKKTLKTKYKKTAEERENNTTIDLMKKYGIDNVRGGDYCQVDTDKMVRCMNSKLYRSIIEAYESKSSLESYKVIDINLKKLLNPDAQVEEVALKRKKNKSNSKADFWWETYKKNS